VTPRLLTEKAAAAYLSLPLASVRRLTVGRVQVAGRVRFDRTALDHWLDGDTPTTKVAASNENASEADDALAAFIANHPHVTRRRS
jgi:hypothetical protein